MATQLFLVENVFGGAPAADTHLGTDSTTLAGANVGWATLALATARGDGVSFRTTSTVTGTTLGVEVGATKVEFISPPVAADVTIAGTITANIWAAESNMSANVAINVVVDVIRANTLTTRNSNTIVEIGRSARIVEVAVTTRAVNNFTFTPTSTVVNRGDRLRVRIFGDDVGAMATGYTFEASWNGTTAAVDGDTYVTFTENIAFESFGGTTAEGTSGTTSSGTFLARGSGGTDEQAAQSFVAPTSTTLSGVRLRLLKTGAPADNVVIELQSDSGADSPSGTVLGTVATVAGGTLTTSAVDYTYPCSISVTASIKYWIVIRRSGARDTTNYFLAELTTGSYANGHVSAMNSAAWAGFGSNDLHFAAFLAGSTLYLTDTASAVSTASVDREAWTSRGSGVVNDVRNTAAGWTVPLQLTDTAGGTVVDWFTRPLAAFTLTGMAVANIRALESNASANASLRCEIARVDNDGTNATVWASWCIAPISTDNGELGTTEAARTCNISGDDLAISDQQRLRIRIYAEDMSSAAMATSQTVTFYYAGTSAAASGDTYITLPQTVTEYVPAAPHIYIPVGFATGRDY